MVILRKIINWLLSKILLLKLHNLCDSILVNCEVRIWRKIRSYF
jgi:hypothetical protein